MGIRIWHQSGAPLGAMGAYAQAVEKHVRAVVSEGTEVDFHGLPAQAYGGQAPADVLKFAYLRHLILARVVENCIQAEREGYDAVALATYSDPLVREARAAVDIPVISMAECSMLIACGASRRFALVTLTPENVWRLREIVERHGLEKRVSGIYSLEPRTTEKELAAGFDDFPPVRDIFTKTVERAASEGANLVIPAEGVLNEVLFANRCASVAGTPVLDCIGATFLQAELMVKLRRSSGLSIGRRWDHAKPSPELLRAVRSAVGLDPPALA